MANSRAQEGRLPLSVPVSFLRGADAAAAVCPFLGALDEVGVLGDAVPAYDERNRCTAYGPWQPLGRQQQELVCLTVAHTSCPRYDRGLRYGPGGPRGRLQRRVGLALAIIAALAAVAIGGAFVLGGDLSFERLTALLPGGSTAPPTPATSPTSSPAPAPSASPSPTLEPTSSASPETTETASASGSILPTLPPGSPYASLAPCPGSEACYLYTVKSGDTLSGIASRFGTTVAAIRELNPSVANTSIIHVGTTLKIPPP